MLKKKYKNSDEVIDSIIHRPAEAFFSISMDVDLLERMNENAGDMLDSVLEIGNEIISIALYLIICCMHIVEIVFFPVVKMVRFAKIRRDVISREAYFRDMLRNKYNMDMPTE